MAGGKGAERTDMRGGIWLIIVVALGLSVGASARAEGTYPVGISQAEFPAGNRTITLALFYPAVITDKSPRFAMPYYTHLALYDNAEPVVPEGKFPLVMFSHGRGSNGLLYAWFAQVLASHGYFVAAPYHYRANTYDQTIAYLANKLWQRPKDISLAIDFLLDSEEWGKLVDSQRIGMAGHSQGGFTSLWIAGARVNADNYLAFQKRWKNNKMVPAHLREELPLDAAPALDVHDPRIKAAFAMAPGIIQAFGMDAAGLGQLRVPVYITVGAGDTQTPPKQNAEFAAKHIPNAELHVIPGRVDHEIFVNQCDQEGKDEFPEACIDAPGVDRGAIHKSVGEAALKFFGAHLSAAKQ